MDEYAIGESKNYPYIKLFDHIQKQTPEGNDYFKNTKGTILNTSEKKKNRPLIM